MAIQTLFQSYRGEFIPATDTQNFEAAPAYRLSPKQALAQYAATGCFGRTFYSTEQDQLTRVLELCSQLEPEFVAKVAIYARRDSLMKDMPALLCAWLAAHAPQLHELVFPQVVDNMKMLRTYVQILRSGVAGRKSFGTAPKRLIRGWLAARNEDAIFRSSTGANPSVADIVKMVHPKPETKQRAAFYAYLVGRPFEKEALTPLVSQFEQFKAGETDELPDLPLTLLTALPLKPADWASIALRSSWQATRMNLNTFERHGAFAEPGVAEKVAERLRNPREILRARAFPYQLLAAYRNAEAIPAIVRDALHDAMQIALENVPAVTGKVYVCPDVSGSMSSPVTGYRKGATTAMRCIDVAALAASAILHKNPEAEVLPFEQDVLNLKLDPRDTVITNANRLASVGGGGTNCSAPLRQLNKQKAKGDLVIFLSDNQSWVDARQFDAKRLGAVSTGGTALMHEWGSFRHRNPGARMICLDLQPFENTQALEREDILNIGGFSDQVFELMAAFTAGSLEPDHWAGRIEAIQI